MSEAQLDERELEEKPIGEKELAERALLDKLKSFKSAVDNQDPDTTILEMLKDFMDSDPPSEDLLRVSMARSGVVALVGAKHTPGSCSKEALAVRRRLILWPLVRNPDVATIADLKLHSTAIRRWKMCGKATQQP